jgi:hypothetical protein
MTRLAILAACVALSGCATQTQTQVLSNLTGCKRVYKGAVQGGLLGGGFIGSVDVTCEAAAIPPEEAQRLSSTARP